MSNDSVYLECHEQIATTRRKKDYGSEVYGVKVRLLINDDLIGAWGDLMQMSLAAGNQRLAILQANRLLFRGSFQWQVTVTDKLNVDAAAESFFVPATCLVVEATFHSGLHPQIQIKPPPLDACSKKIKATSIADLFMNTLLNNDVAALRTFLASPEMEDKPFARQNIVNNLLRMAAKEGDASLIRGLLNEGLRVEDCALESGLDAREKQLYLSVLREVELNVASQSDIRITAQKVRL